MNYNAQIAFKKKVRKMTTYGYARVSTNGQDPGSQEAELMAAYLRDNPCPYLHGVPMKCTTVHLIPSRSSSPPARPGAAWSALPARHGCPV